MSFYNIQDPTERDAKMKEYLALKNKTKQRNMNEKVAHMREQEDMQEMFKPASKSNEEMAKAITNDLVPIQQELENLNETIRNRGLQNRIQQTPRGLPPLPTTPEAPTRGGPQKLGFRAASHLEEALNEENDSVTSIHSDKDGKMMIWDTTAEITSCGCNLKIGDRVYKGTDGLWSLITKNNPKQNTQEDLDNYSSIMKETNALYQNNDPGGEGPRASGGPKFKVIQRHISSEMHGVEGSGIFATELSKWYETDPSIRRQLVHELTKLAHYM